MRLEINVAESFEAMRVRSVEHARRFEAGETVDPLCDIGFDNMAQFGVVFTNKRWELVEALKAAGPMSIYALAKQLERNYSNVHKDVSALMEWLVIEKDESGRVFVPWDEIDVRWPLLKKVA